MNSDNLDRFLSEYKGSEDESFVLNDLEEECGIRLKSKRKVPGRFFVAKSFCGESDYQGSRGERYSVCGRYIGPRRTHIERWVEKNFERGQRYSKSNDWDSSFMDFLTDHNRDE